MNSTFLQDILYGFRQLRRNPYVTTLAILCLAAGIGLSTFMFSITYSIVGRGLPFEDQKGIVHVMRQERPDVADGRTLIHLDDFVTIKEQQTSFEHLSAFTNDFITGGKVGHPHRMSGAYVSAGFFDVMPVSPLLGRTFMEDDCLPDSDNVLIISEGVWKDHYASDPGIIGQQIMAEGQPYIIVGVLPEAYDYPFNQEVWLPLVPETLKAQTGWIDFVTLVGRLREDRSIEDARAEFDLIFTRIEELEAVPDLVHQRPSLEPLFARFVNDDIRVLMWSMFGATFLVLLIACSNVSSILTARMVVRSNELAIRSALGASRTRIMRQILGEALLYGILGAVLGIVLAARALDYLWQFLSQQRFAPPAFMEFYLDPVSIVVAVSLMLVAVVVAGILPAWRSSKPNISGLLNDSQRTGSSKRLSRLSSASAIMQLAFSFGLLVAAGRLIAAIILMGTLDYPFNEKNLHVGSISVDNESYPEPADQVRFWDEIHRNLKTSAGAEKVSLGFNMPCLFAMQDPIRIDGEDYSSKEEYPVVRVDVVGTGYFDTLGVEILQGRDFNDGDIRGKASVAIINTVMAEKFWPGENPIGKVFHHEGKGDFNNPDDRVHTVIGVVPDLRMAGLINDEDDGTGFYRPQGQSLWGDQKIFIRTSGGNPKALIPEVQRVVGMVDPDVAFTEAMPFEQHVEDAFFYFRFFLSLFSTFGVMALLLAGAGLYGIIQYSVSQRIVEIGIRMSLGATPSRIRWMVLWKGLRNLAIGIVLGLGIAILLTRVLGAVFEGVPEEYYSYGTALVVLLVVSLLANGFPAQRASRMDPMVALRVQ